MTRKAALRCRYLQLLLNPHLQNLSKQQLKMNVLEWMFGRQMTPAERLRKHQRALEKTQRELDRERVKLENQEKKLVQDIKKSAKNGQMGAVKIQAKDLVRTRRCVRNQKRSLASTDWEFKIYHKILLNADTVASHFLEDTSRLSSPFSPSYGAAQLTRSQTVRSNEKMMQSMKGATSLLSGMNRQMNLPALQRIAMEFERENDIMDQRQEMMDDAIDDVTGLEDEEEEDEVVNQILDELGIDLGQAVSRLVVVLNEICLLTCQ